MENIALVTGASRGLGKEIACELARQGVSVVLVSRDTKQLKDTCLSLRNSHRHDYLALDLTKTGAARKIYQFFLKKKVFPQVIIHNLGGKVNGDTHPVKLEVLRKALELNLGAAIEINNLFIPLMIKRGVGRIIHISSNAGITGNSAPAYAVAKGALNSYVKNIARYYAAKNIMICAVLPGILDHPGSEWDKKKKDEPFKYRQRLSRMPLGRFGKPQEVAQTVAHLAISDSMMCAGSLISLEGAE